MFHVKQWRSLTRPVRDTYLSVALAGKERAELDDAAESEQITTSAFVRREALRAARAAKIEDDGK